MQAFLGDLLYECRQLVKHRNYTAVAALVLSVGVGANTLMFSGANAVLFRPLPFDDSPRLVYVRSVNTQSGFERAAVSAPDFAAWKERIQSFDSLSAFYVRSHSLVSPADQPERLSCAHVSSDLFQALKVGPALGRAFIASEDRPDGEKVAILSYGLWQRRFGADPAVVGKRLDLDGDLYRIRGVMARGFWFPSRSTELWLPLASDPLRSSRSERFLTVVGALKRGRTPAGAQTEAEGVAAGLAHRFADTNAGWSVAVAPMREERLSTLARAALFVLLVAVAFVLLIAAANVSSLFLVQLTARRREFAIRVSIGASRPRLVRQLLTHASLLALLGAMGGLLVTICVKPLLVSAIPPHLRDFNDLVIDHRVFAYNIVLPMLTCLLCGLAPAVRLSRPDLAGVLQEGGYLAGGATGRRVFRALLIGEVALSIVMTIGAGLAIRGFLHVLNFDFGFRPAGLLTFRIELPPGSYPERHRQENFYELLLAKCRALPGVMRVSASDALPIGGRVGRVSAVVPVHVIGGSDHDRREPASALMHIVMPRYFEVMGISLLRGRDFLPRDKSDEAPVAVVSDAFVKRYSSGQDLLGRRLEVRGGTLQVVGVVASIRAEGPDRPPAPEIYLPYLQHTGGAMTVVVRSSGAVPPLARAIRAQVAEIDRRLPVDEMATMDTVVEESYAGPHVFTWMAGVFAAIAAAIAVVGMYSVVSHYVSLRTREMGIRIALGAGPKHLYMLIVRYVMFLIATGAAIGIPAGIALSRGMKGLLFGVSPFDPVVFVGVAILLALMTVLACLGPVRQAIRIDPAVSIRSS